MIFKTGHKFLTVFVEPNSTKDKLKDGLVVVFLICLLSLVTLLFGELGKVFNLLVGTPTSSNKER